jgi:crossover junction endodeoxyribonuclease RuvC
VLGIDPGTAACGFGVVERDGARLRAVAHGTWRTRASERPQRRLGELFERCLATIEEHAPDAAAIEESFVGSDARTALSVGQARGALLVACARGSLDCAEYSPARVKKAVCGFGGAEKLQVQRMVASILALSAPPTPHHAADALAVAICRALEPPLLQVAV